MRHSSLGLHEHVDPSEGLVVLLLSLDDFGSLNCRLSDSVDGQAPVEPLEVAFALLTRPVRDGDVDPAGREDSVNLIQSELDVHLGTVARQDAVERALVNDGLVLAVLHLGHLHDIGLLVGDLDRLLLVVFLHLFDDDGRGVDIRNFLVPVVSHVF